ncbi:MAG: hypothetical protein ABI779_14440 [Acidobacteriota bacterium]
MHRFRVAAVLVLAVLLAAQLTLHNHSLIPESGSTTPLACPVCAFGADAGALDTPLFITVLVVLGTLIARSDVPLAAVVHLATAGRAPPAI